MSFKISNPFLRKSSSPLNNNHERLNKNLNLRQLPQWALNKRANMKEGDLDPLRFLSEEEQALMSDEDRYNYYESMLINEENRIKGLEQNIRNYVSSTTEADPESGVPIPTYEDHPGYFNNNFLQNRFDKVTVRQPKYDDQGYPVLDKQGNQVYYDEEVEFNVDPTGDVLTKNYPEISKWLGESWACNSLSCSILAQNGYTIPRDVNGDGIVDDSDEVQSAFQGKLKGGDPMAIEPGTARFNEMHTQLGFTLAPAGTKPDPERVQLIRRSSWDESQDPRDMEDGTVVGMSDLNPNNPNYLGHGHSILTTGYADPNKPDQPIQIHGVNQYDGTVLDSERYDFDKFADANNDGLPDQDEGGNTWRIMNYTGDMPYWQKKIESMKDWKTNFDANKAAEEERIREEIGLPSQNKPWYGF